MEAFVDRIEGDVAVLLIGGRTFDVPRALLPRDVKEGDTVLLSARRAPGSGPTPPPVPWKDE